MSEQRGKPIEVHVMAGFKCERCGTDMRAMGTAPLLEDGRVDMEAGADHLQQLICNDCTRKERDAEHDEAKRRRAQAAWVKKHTPKVKR